MFSLVLTLLLLLSVSLPDAVRAREIERQPLGRPGSQPGRIPERLGAPAPGQDVVPLVVGSSIIVPDKTLERQQYQDAVYSTLLAQLASDKKLGHKNPTQWYSNYKDVTGHLGWTIETFDTFSKYQQRASKVDLSTVVSETLNSSGKLTATELAAVEKSTAALRQSVNRSPLSVFNNRSKLGKSGIFQVAVVSNDGGVLRLKFGSYYYASTVEESSVLFFPWSARSLTVYARVQVLELNEEVYNQLRSVVAQKLEKYRNLMIKPIKV